jgi:16S rRNA (cytosine1402-N4)-methyltransferase
MSEPTYHVPVLGPETVAFFAEAPPGSIVDATFGGGGHTSLLLQSRQDIDVIALDRDPDAASQVPDDPRLHFVAANFGRLGEVLADLAGPGEGADAIPQQSGLVSGVVFDLGVSSHQLDARERGFSYRAAGPLDMRMGDDAELSAGDVVNTWTVGDLTRVIRRYGEERYASRIAAAIVSSRPIANTLDLANVIAEAVPAAARRDRHPARRTFQAIRIAVNRELDELERGLEAAIEWTRPGGRIAVISYHSLEDRIVKRRFIDGSTGCTCPPDLPVCACATTAELRRLTRKPVRPTDEEIARNPRARSARLRVVEKVAA